jgi:hypothetical protein
MGSASGSVNCKSGLQAKFLKLPEPVSILSPL